MLPSNIDELVAAAPDASASAEPRKAYRHTALFIEPGQVANRIDRNERVRLLVAAENIERRTKQRGRHGGAIGRCGIVLLRTLLFTYCGQDGRCFPSLKTLARSCAMSLQAVVSALKRLEMLGLVRRVQRLKRVRLTRVNGWTGLLETYVGTAQASNAYVFGRPIGGASLCAPPATDRVSFPSSRQAGFFDAWKLTPTDRQESRFSSYPHGFHTASTTTR